jgi:2TM domain-containing protein
MFKDLSMRIFLGHLVAYVVVTAICAAINLWLSPSTLWFPWVLIGWGVVVAIHAFALLLRKTRRRERIFIDRKARAFAVHLFAYVAVVLVLLFVNLTLTPKVWWFHWVALGWGAGVLAQGLCVFLKNRKKTPASVPQQAEAKQVESKSQPPEKKKPRKPAPRKPSRKPDAG